MTSYLRFLLSGLVLGLNTEIQLKLVAGINPQSFIVTLFAYPIIISLSYAGSRMIDRSISSLWKGDIIHYLGVGFIGLAFEWVLLGNGPESNAFQPGMFAMWTTFCFGPRILTRASPVIEKGSLTFWLVFGLAAIILSITVLLITNMNARIVIAVFGLSGTYIVLSVWLLLLAWRTRQKNSVIK